MKIKEWIVVGIVVGLASASRSLGAPEMGVLDHLEQTEQSVRELDANVGAQKEDLNPRWKELEAFQTAVWRAMALDPTQPVIVPAAEVPKSLYAFQLNKELDSLLEELKESAFAKEYGAQAEFEQYIQTATKIIEHRKARQFPMARAIAKRGTLDAQYELLMQKIPKPEPKKPATLKQIQQVLNNLDKTREIWVNQSKDSEKKNIFGNSNQQFAWVMIAIFLGFFLGIAAYRISPDFFQKFLDSGEFAQPPRSPHGRLDYGTWLREFEDHLTRLKTSQVSHERRIEEVVGVSERITQQALSIYADAHVKNEASLESKMSMLLTEIQHQFEQGQKLSGGDRAQIHQMLEHCLKLCDAIENQGVHYDKTKMLSEGPDTKSA